MFKAFKYLLLASLYKKAKKSFVILFISIVALLLVSFIMDDMMSISFGIPLYLLILVKWILILILWSVIGFSILKIFNIATNPFKPQEDKISQDQQPSNRDIKKDRVLAKDELFTQSDLIMQKYMKD